MLKHTSKKTKTKRKYNTMKNKMGGAFAMNASAGKGKSKSKGKGKSKAKGKGNQSVPAPLPSLERSVTCSHLIYNSLHNHEDKKDYLKDLFDKDVMIKLALRILSQDMTDDIIFDIDDKDSGIYLSWMRGATALVTVSIHTGMYDDGSTVKNVRTCIKKGNAHIFFNKLNVVPKQIKFTADDDVFMTSVKLTNSEEANTIITTIIEILREYVKVQM